MKQEQVMQVMNDPLARELFKAAIPARLAYTDWMTSLAQFPSGICGMVRSWFCSGQSNRAIKLNVDKGVEPSGGSG